MLGSRDFADRHVGPVRSRGRLLGVHRRGRRPPRRGAPPRAAVAGRGRAQRRAAHGRRPGHPLRGHDPSRPIRPEPAKTFLPGRRPGRRRGRPPAGRGVRASPSTRRSPPSSPQGVLVRARRLERRLRPLRRRTGGLQFTFARADEPVTRRRADRPLPPGAHRLGVVYTPGATGEGTFTLVPRRRERRLARLRGRAAVRPPARRDGAVPRVLTAGSRSSDAYTPPAPWNGTLHRVVFETPGTRPGRWPRGRRAGRPPRRLSARVVHGRRGRRVTGVGG